MSTAFRIEILNTGTELMLGNTLNTHGAWFGRELFALGLRVSRQTVVPDGDAIREAMAEAVKRADVLIVTGGLGPTSDDLTRQITAELLGIELIEDEAALRSIEAYFAKRQRAMAPVNRVQALVPVGADVLPNAHGTAPGVYVPPRLNPHAPCAIFLLPGPPRELYPMFHAEVAPRVRALSGVEAALGATELKFACIGESDFHQGIDAALNQIPDLEVGYCAHTAEVDLRLIGPQAARNEGRRIALDAFGKHCVSEDGSSLEANVLRLLRARDWKLATAESCTGGLISSRLTDVPGSSSVFTHGFITYANEAKVELLNVSPALLEQHGAVSEEVARAMAEGALAASQADVAVAVTGIAGPDGGSAEKPVGTAWIAVAVRNQPTTALKRLQPTDRINFKRSISQHALEAVRQTVA